MARAGSWGTAFAMSTKKGLSGSMLVPRMRPSPNIAPFTTSALSTAWVSARRTRTSEYGFFELFSARITSLVVLPDG